MSPLEVGEISDEDAIIYLVCKGVPESKAKKAVEELTGGLFVELNTYIEEYKKKTFEVIIKEKDNVIDDVLKKIKLSINHPLFIKINQGHLDWRGA